MNVSIIKFCVFTSLFVCKTPCENKIQSYNVDRHGFKSRRLVYVACNHNIFVVSFYKLYFTVHACILGDNLAGSIRNIV